MSNVYEYKVVKVEPRKRAMEKSLNKYAKKGWELVESIEKPVLAFGHKTTVTLRRMK